MSATIQPHQLPHALDGHDDVAVLSLDCFDTLLWRDSHAPRDLFGALPGITVQQRQWAEMRARSLAALRHHRNEVTVAEIYAELMPQANSAERAAAIECELEAEARHCFAFHPTVELMRAAKATGRRVIVVSDTYFDAAQLRGLIAAAAGDPVAALIDTIYCSSAHGLSKGEGLYREVLKRVGVPAARILHIGDNKRADVDGVAPSGVTTLHLAQFTRSTEQRLRLESAIGAMLHPEVAERIASHQPHRAAISAHEAAIADPAEAFGFGVIGAVLYGFDAWLRDEAAALGERGGRVHWLYLMRDGHLPMLAHEARGDAIPVRAIEISRFTATAASFRDERTVQRYVQFELEGDLSALGKQLMLPAGEIDTILADLPARGAPDAFLRAIRKPQRMQRILKASAAMAERLAAHVRRAVDPQPGDTLMLVDLGYNGSVQNDVEPALRRLLGVHVAGRYLLLREQFQSGLDKRGFIDSRHYDAATLEALTGNVAVLEQLCTAPQGSVIDYAPDGAPIRRGNGIKGRQSAIRERVQAGCLRFVREQPGAAIRASMPDHAQLWLRGATAALGRLMFLPLPHELDVLRSFEHDVNLGTDQHVALFDPEVARRGLRQRGLFYMKGAQRMYLPAELDGEGLALKLSLFAHRRFGLPLNFNDFVDRSIELPVAVADGTALSVTTIAATPTHDGYFVAPVPIGDCRFTVGVQFGKLYEWVQIESATFVPVERFLSEKTQTGNDEVEAVPSLEGMAQVAPYLFRCDDDSAFMMVPPPERRDAQPMLLLVVFRPIAPREPHPVEPAVTVQLTHGAAA